MSIDDPEQYIRQKFPAMKPIKSTPPLFGIYGFGLGLAGRRDLDPETGTYIKTHCLTALFIPVFALGAYRVADARDGGWIVVGKEETSTIARALSAFVALATVFLTGFGIWSSHTGSDEYKAKAQLAEAQELEAKGKRLDAAKLYLGIIENEWPEKEAAKIGITSNLTTVLKSGSPSESVAMISFVENLPSHLTSSGEFLPNVSAQALEASQRFSESDPKGAYTILKAGRVFPNQPDEYLSALRSLLERLVMAEPDDADYAIALAEVFYLEQETEKALALLDPLKDSLGPGEGARVYGLALVRAARVQEASVHLKRYIDPRLKTWRAAAKRFETRSQSVTTRILTKLDRGEGPPLFYKEYEAAPTEEEKDALVNTYLYQQLQKDTEYLAATRDYEKSTAIIPVIMSLGIAQLQTAQASSNAAERKTQLGEAEQTFLTLREGSGGSDDLNFFLGQVYYWSGKQEEGRALFDQLLAANRRDAQTLLTVGRTLREVGSNTEARALAEEAYRTGSTEEKGQAAILRSLLALTEKIVSSPTYRRGVELLEKGLVLAPNSQNMYSTALAYYSYAANTEALKRLEAKTLDAQVDLTKAREEYLLHNAGEKDDDIRKGQAVSQKEWEEILTAVSDGTQKRYAEIGLAQSRLSLFNLGEKTSPEAEIEALRAMQPEGDSSRLRGVLLNALAQKSLTSISAGNSDFAEDCSRAALPIGFNEHAPGASHESCAYPDCSVLD